MTEQPYSERVSGERPELDEPFAVVFTSRNGIHSLAMGAEQLLIWDSREACIPLRNYENAIVERTGLAVIHSAGQQSPLVLIRCGASSGEPVDAIVPVVSTPMASDLNKAATTACTTTSFVWFGEYETNRQVSDAITRDTLAAELGLD